MHTVHQTPALAVTATATRDLDADLIILPVFEDDDFADEAGLNDACAGEIERARQRGELTGKAFELFFTTKERGSGLGLPLTREIVRAHGGRIEVSRASEREGGGARFEVWLPAASAVTPVDHSDLS